MKTKLVFLVLALGLGGLITNMEDDVLPSYISEVINPQSEAAAPVEETQIEVEPEVVEEVIEPVVYDGLTLVQLGEKLERSMNSTLSGYGSFFALYAVDLGLDPYLALAVVLEETGCKWECSELVKQCNNIGGQKGAPGCWGGSYQTFATLEDGIRGFMDNLYYNYYAQGLTTATTINSKYAENPNWKYNVDSYIEAIRYN